MRNAFGALPKIALAAAVLMVGVSVSYYFVIYLPKRDAALEHARKEEVERAEWRRELEAARAAAERRASEEKIAAERRAAEEKLATEKAAVTAKYMQCISNAERNYSNNWDAACHRLQEIGRQAHESCITNGLSRTTCDSIHKDRNKPKEDCSLPESVADRINASLKESRERCVKESQLGLR